MRTKRVLFVAALAALFTAVSCRITQEVEVEWLPGTFVDTTSAGCPVGLVLISSPAGAFSGPVGTTRNFDGTVQVPSGCVSPEFDWRSSNESVVTINSDGLATIVGVGTAEICMVLRADNTVRRCVTVTGTANPTCTVTGVNIMGITSSLAIGSTVGLSATVASNPNGCATQGVTWSSSNNAIATVSSAGVVTGVSPGTVTITATSIDDPSRSNTFTITVTSTTTPTVTIGALAGMSMGNGCATTQPLVITVNGVTNPAISVSSSNPGVATVNGSGTSWTVTRVAAGQVTFTVSVTGSNLSSPITFTTPAMTVGTADCTTPGTVSIGTLVGMSTGTNCAATQPLVVTTNGITNPAINVTSSNTAVATVSGSGTNWVVTRTGAGTVTFTASVTGSNQLTPVTFTTPAITVGTTPCSGAGTFTFNPAAVCFGSASPATATLTVTAADMPAGTVINVSSSNTSLVTVSPSSFTFPSGTITLTRVGTATGNVTLTASGNGATGAIPVQVLSTACPGTGQTIDYTPGGGTIGSGSTPPGLTAVCTQGGATITCPNQPFWTSDHPEILAVRGSTQDSQGFWVGNTATLTRISSGGSTVVQICVQWSKTQTSPRTCHGWTVP